jgi:hypothetical protein
MEAPEQYLDRGTALALACMYSDDTSAVREVHAQYAHHLHLNGNVSLEGCH